METSFSPEVRLWAKLDARGFRRGVWFGAIVAGVLVPWLTVPHSAVLLEWAVFLGIGPILWVAGARLFLRSGLTSGKKIVWAVFLVLLGGCVGLWMPLPAIRSRFLVLLAVLPVLALLDARLASSRRGFLFWFRACAFEVCTVFGSAALVRLGLDLIRRAS